MKRMWIGIGLLAVVLIGGVWSGKRMMNTHLPCAEDLEHAAACAMAEDWGSAGALAEKARDTWQQNRKISASVTDHEPMDEIDAIFEELEVYRAREETAAYSAGCMYLAEQLRDLGNSFRLSWWNIL